MSAPPKSGTVSSWRSMPIFAGGAFRGCSSGLRSFIAMNISYSPGLSAIAREIFPSPFTSMKLTLSHGYVAAAGGC